MLYSATMPPPSPARLAIQQAYRQDEASLLDQMLPLASLSAQQQAQVQAQTREIVLAIRDQYSNSGIEALLNEFSLSTQEGIVLMCLAEALLRIPDTETVDSLIRDKLGRGDWAAHLGHSDSLFVNASVWGLLLTGKVVAFGDPAQPHGVLESMLASLGEPVIRSATRYAMQLIGSQFVLATDIDKAVQRAKTRQQQGYCYSYDMLGEGARSWEQAERHLGRYRKAIEVIARNAEGQGVEDRPGISVKLSALHPRYHYGNREAVQRELLPRVVALARAAYAHNMGLTIDAEECARLELSLDIVEGLLQEPTLALWQGLGVVIQSYQRRALALVDWVLDVAASHRRRLMVRLVKGAYWDSEIKRAQQAGLDDYPVFTRKATTDICYLACARKLLEARDWLYPQFASHNAYTLTAVLAMAGDTQGFELQRLHGMGDGLFEQLLARGVRCRIYAPVGVHADLLAYLVRRLLENGANSSFVGHLADRHYPITRLLEDPVAQARGWAVKANPAIARPGQLYGNQRRNSRGLDLSDPLLLRQLHSDLLEQQQLSAPAPQAALHNVYNPADNLQWLGAYSPHSSEQISALIDQAQAQLPAWSALTMEQRAAYLDALANALEQDRSALMALCIREAGKSVEDALAEVREAVDFCRYYASQARSGASRIELGGDGLLPAGQPHGVALCISPWNFPLAIFIGQAVAALVVGNTVLAKPAEQTSLIALRVRLLMDQCEIPAHALQLVLGAGKAVGPTLLSDARIAAVLFTGSNQTAYWLAERLARRAGSRAALLAETGGLNAMIVDSSALLEQVVDDVLYSAFNSAGQRCSALRVLFVHDCIADQLIALLSAAMGCLKVGNPALLATDVGPVIDDAALLRLHQHEAYLKQQGQRHFRCELPDEAVRGHFFSPQLYELSSMDALNAEVFGPLLHVVRYRGGEIDQVIAQINRSGYGLTLGVHSRIEQFWRSIAQRVRVGNIYINRNMVGAVVGVQPFGGRGLSGTGPKAGGPYYLNRLRRYPAPLDLPKPQLPAMLPTRRELAQLGLCLEHLSQGRANWAALGFAQRLLMVQRALAALLEAQESVQVVVAQLREQLDELPGWAARHWPDERPLPGPTGESNSLSYEPRGTIAVLFSEPFSPLHWLQQLLMALLAGNTVIALCPASQGEWMAALQEGFRRAGISDDRLVLLALKSRGLLRELLADQRVDAVLINHSQACAALAETLLLQVGARLRPVLTEPFGEALMQRLVLEKTLTINTAAAGGNADLLSLDM